MTGCVVILRWFDLTGLVCSNATAQRIAADDTLMLRAAGIRHDLDLVADNDNWNLAGSRPLHDAYAHVFTWF